MQKIYVDNTEQQINSSYIQSGKAVYVFKHLPYTYKFDIDIIAQIRKNDDQTSQNNYLTKFILNTFKDILINYPHTHILNLLNFTVMSNNEYLVVINNVYNLFIWPINLIESM